MSQNAQALKLELKVIRLNSEQINCFPSGLGVVVKGRLAALVEVVSGSVTRTPLQLAQRYQQALAVWWQEESATVLPVRAGAIFEGPAAVAAWLQENTLELEQTLTRLENKVEMGFRLLIPPDAPLKVSSGTGRGRDYMQQLAQRETRLSAVEALVRQLGSLAEDYNYEAAQSDLFSPRAAFLVSRPKLAQFVSAVQHSGIKGVLTGPLPPFSFV